MKTDILIPLNDGSRHDNLELRYCLRSVEKHLKNVGNVLIVGEKPEWLTNVVHVPKTENFNNWKRAENIYNKIIAGIDYEDRGVDYIAKLLTGRATISDNFLFVNDDHFLLEDYDAGSYPYYHRGPVNLKNFELNRPQYQQMKNTLSLLPSTDYEPVYDFDIHCPIVYNKHLFTQSLPKGEWPDYGYGIKSIYGYYLSDSMLVYCEDLKFHQPLMKQSIYQALEDRGWFSIGDRCLKSGDMKNVLQELYPNKSKYEL